ncbi:MULTISPECIES: aminotransferase class I/II-fold pyridoxal phosphate-dependent enzyme [unclassified Paenibacillus]|uniref:aminotransferase-like domain-containing protein n=1 Tax=unclassified Paenibacillus TaxID=185978 RepID=UPI0024065805|nr:MULTISPECIES: aminotransferase class I/II-fold pyridoxal phosphate-dependent enzyme [unclassified Paenibacillus]MDF9842691.1 GntR family transcriptional regulator/MocR family aminotransferase [Paenibacillus sp. PastF-2]MDF9849441.1 GntR family transcriptional regulator/MocR family aminotransferase [Paenibacillus sp. PastM-2]MDF9855851.1 GntR family transcriptional regulator/MocR family aminotransferase [Paenibacillus sp. PastF-1]
MNFTLPYEQYLDIYRYKYLALYHALRTAILGGTLPAGARLPSTRKLAELYQLSRGSASQVYDMLLADGYIQTERGRGTFVSEAGVFGVFGEDGGKKAAGEPPASPAGFEREGHLETGSSVPGGGGWSEPGADSKASAGNDGRAGAGVYEEDSAFLGLPGEDKGTVPRSGNGSEPGAGAGNGGASASVDGKAGAGNDGRASAGASNDGKADAGRASASAGNGGASVDSKAGAGNDGRAGAGADGRADAGRARAGAGNSGDSASVDGKAGASNDGRTGAGADTAAAVSGGVGTVEEVPGYVNMPSVSAATVKLSAWGERLMERQLSVYERAGNGFISFRSSGMEQGQFPYSEWRSALNYAGGKQGGLLDSYCPPQGDEGLRRAIAAHLRITRGIRAEAGQIVLFSGSMQGIVILTQLLLEQGSCAVVEDPGYHGIRRAVEISGGSLLPGRVDAEGLVPEDWAARLLFVTPSRQFPTGAVLPLERRRRLLEWARRHQAVIIEDDYDSEFRWGGRPIEPLKALDREERVVYVGSFSNSMFFGLRVGFAVLPSSLVAPVTAAKALYEPLPAGQLEQRALARFMGTGGYSRHLRRMTRIYGERARLLRSLLAERLGTVFEVLPGDAGLHLYARWLRTDAEFAAFRAAALRRGADFRDAALYRIRPSGAAACFSFSHLDAAALEEGVNRLQLAWNDVQKRA